MSSHQLFVVDTEMKLEQAVVHAQKTYDALVANQVIEAGLTTDSVDNAFEPCFKITRGYKGLDDITSIGKQGRAVHGISLNLFGHYWADVDGVTTLLEFDATAHESSLRQRMDGFFFNHDGGFSARCPKCKTEVHISDEESDGFAQAITDFVSSPDMPSLNCHQCHNTTLLNQYHSNDFAVGYFGVTLNGIGVLKASREQRIKLLKDFGFDSFGEQIAFVSCHN